MLIDFAVPFFQFYKLFDYSYAFISDETERILPLDEHMSPAYYNLRDNWPLYCV